MKRDYVALSLAVMLITVSLMPLSNTDISMSPVLAQSEETEVNPVVEPGTGDTLPLNPEIAEFFQLSFPLSNKPNLTANRGAPTATTAPGMPAPTPASAVRAIVWNALVDHTPPFNADSVDRVVRPYTGDDLAPGI